MSFAEMISDPLWRGELLCERAEGFLHGSLGTEARGGGWVRPRRFLEAQVRALGSCSAWHPGLFRQMSRTSAGVCIEFLTNSSEIALELRTPGLAHAVRGMLPRGAADEPDFDGVACEVDGELLPLSWGEPLPPAEGSSRAAGGTGWMERLVCFSLMDERRLPAAGVLPLPGLGAEHHVRLWLPCLHEVEVRDIWGDGQAFEACPERPLLVVVGDGSAQGTGGDPACSWAARLSERLGLDLLDQGLVRQVFQPLALAGLGSVGQVAAVVVELGEGYRTEPCRLREVSHDVRGFLAEVARLWGELPVWVVVPDEDGVPMHPRSCFGEAIALVEQAAMSCGLTPIAAGDLSHVEVPCDAHVTESRDVRATDPGDVRAMEPDEVDATAPGKVGATGQGVAQDTSAEEKSVPFGKIIRSDI